MATVRTRFAPSPTGVLHLGNARVAVFNWLFTRHHGGAVVLRIEDTDLDRNLPNSEAAILDDLRWLGLDWDEGPDVGGPYGPYRQSERGQVHAQAARRLVAEGKAYSCFCTEAETADEGHASPGESSVRRYSGRCRELSPEQREELLRQGARPAIRFAVPPDNIEVEDEIRGSINFPGNELGDFIILRSDGRPTYNFAVVVDDLSMRITHVIRGAGHLSNTPKQALLFDALGGRRPAFVHLGMVLGADRAKLSKREGSAGLADLREQGFHPEGVVNYLQLLGWSSPDEREVLTREELVAGASLERLGAADTVFDPEKLRWMSQQHIAAMPLKALIHDLDPFLDRARFPLEGDALAAAVDAVRSRLSTFADIQGALALLFPAPGPELEAARKDVREDAESRRVLGRVGERLAGLDSWNEAALGRAVRDAGKDVGARGPALFHPVRKALSGLESGPDLAKVLFALGREEALRRIRSTLERGSEPGQAP